MKNTKLEEQLLIKLLLNLVIFKKLYLVKMCPIFDSSPPVFGARYQSFLRVCWFLHKGVPYFGYPSENLNNPTNINYFFYDLLIALYCLSARCISNRNIEITWKKYLRVQGIIETSKVPAWCPRITPRVVPTFLSSEWTISNIFH